MEDARTGRDVRAHQQYHMEEKPLDEMKRKPELTHGGDWAGYEIEYGKQPLDFSMNVNPLGIPAGVQEAIAKAGRTADRYPDPLCRALRNALSETEQFPAERIFCGSGAADIIFRLARALKPQKAGEDGDPPMLLVTAPTFSEYEAAFAADGWAVRRNLLREANGFRLGEDILDGIGEDTDAVFLCEPNNPTGVATDRRLLQRILGRCRETDTWLIIDECFNGFLEDPGAHTMQQDSDHLIILRAFTKLFGMAGVRLGYCLCPDASVTEMLRQAGPPWNVSSLAQEAGLAALASREHTERGLAIVCRERPWMKERIAEITGTGTERIFGEANYLLFRSPAHPHARPEQHPDIRPGESLDERLRRRGILIRSCENFHGLGPGWYRVAVRTHEENARLIEALKEELA